MGGNGKKCGSLIDHQTFKLGVSHKWFDELSRLILMEQFFGWPLNYFVSAIPKAAHNSVRCSEASQE